MRSDPFCSTLTRSEHGTITFLSQQFFAKGPRPRSISDMAMFQQLPTLQEFGGETVRRIILRSTKGYGWSIFRVNPVGDKEGVARARPALLVLCGCWGFWKLIAILLGSGRPTEKGNVS
jgi:hypothetical protein